MYLLILLFLSGLSENNIVLSATSFNSNEYEVALISEIEDDDPVIKEYTQILLRLYRISVMNVFLYV